MWRYVLHYTAWYFTIQHNAVLLPGVVHYTVLHNNVLKCTAMHYTLLSFLIADHPTEAHLHCPTTTLLNR